jgi:hypothetical protein
MTKFLLINFICKVSKTDYIMSNPYKAAGCNAPSGAGWFSMDMWRVPRQQTRL